MTCAEFIALLKDVILTASAVTGSIVAVKGLGTWKRQLKGGKEYELARRILVTLFRYRDRIDDVRFPGMWAHEMPLPPENEANQMNDEQIRSYVSSKAYQARWDKVQFERTSLNADLLEAEAIWGGDLKNLFSKIFSLESELFNSIRQKIAIENPDTGEPLREAIKGYSKDKRDVMFDYLGSKPDEFKQELNTAIENINKYLKPKISHEKV